MTDIEHAPSRAFQQLLLDNLEYLRRLASRLARNSADAEDLVQITMEKALRNDDRFQMGSNARGWLARIMTNCFIDGEKRRARRSPAGVPVEEIPSPPPPSAEPAWSKITIEDVRRALGDLKPNLRHVFQLFHFEGLSYEQIAARERIAKNTVGSRLFRAREAVRSQLEARS